MSKLRLVITAASAIALGASAVSAQGILRKTGQDQQTRNRDGSYGTNPNAGVILRGSRSRADAEGIPPGQMPPAGLCRVWIDGVPPGRQPRATDCATARANAPSNSRVIYGGDVNGRGAYDPRYDRNRDDDRRYDRSAEGRRREEERMRAERARDRRVHEEYKVQQKRQREFEKAQQKRQRELEKSRRKHDGNDERDDDRDHDGRNDDRDDHRDKKHGRKHGH